jgi:hypothetical protein
MKKLIPLLVGVFALALTPAISSAHNHGDKMMKSDKAPSTVIHVVTVSWNEDASEADIQKALDGVHTLADAYDGILRVWTKTRSAQGNRSHAFVMEFKDEQALIDYAGSQEQKDWYEVYIPVRHRSTTFGIMN